MVLYFKSGPLVALSSGSFFVLLEKLNSNWYGISIPLQSCLQHCLGLVDLTEIFPHYIVVVVVGASEHQSGDMMKFVFQIDLSVIAALISSLLSPVYFFKTSISVVFGRPLLRGSSGAQKISEPAGSLWRETCPASVSRLLLMVADNLGIGPYSCSLDMCALQETFFTRLSMRVYVPSTSEVNEANWSKARNNKGRLDRRNRQWFITSTKGLWGRDLSIKVFLLQFQFHYDQAAPFSPFFRHRERFVINSTLNYQPCLLSAVQWVRRFSFTSYWFAITWSISFLIGKLLLRFSGTTNSQEFRFQKVKRVWYRFYLGWAVLQGQFSALLWSWHTKTTSSTTGIAWTMQVLTSPVITLMVMFGSLVISEVIRNATASLSVLSYGFLFWNCFSRISFRVEYCFGPT